MKSQGGGDIINISSIVGKRYFPQGPMYSATKFAVRAFGESLRIQIQEWNIRITTIYPGQTDTPMLTGFTEEERKKFIKAEDLAGAIIFALKYPPGISINEIVVRPTWQEI